MRDNGSWIAAGAVIVALVLTHVYTALGAELPVYWEDEAGYLGNAQVLAGIGEIPDLRGRPYYIGWSLFLVPLWWMFQDGQSVYLGAVVLSAICGIAIAAPLALIARRFGLTWPWSIVAGSTIALAPARSLLSGFGLPENLLALLVAFAALYALKFHAEKTLGNALGLALFVAGAFATHGRVVPMAIATGLWFVFTARRRFVPSVVGLATMAVVGGGSFVLYRRVTTLIYGETGERESVGINRIFNAEFLPTLMSGVGQVWYLVFAWMGLAVIGLIVMSRRLGPEWKAMNPGPATWGLLTLLGMSIISFTSIASAIARGSARLDILSYGRYLDPVVAPIALIGLVMVIRVLSRRMALATFGITALVGVLWFTIVWPNIPTEGTVWWAPINVTGTLQYGWHWNSVVPLAPWLPATALVLIALGLVYFLRNKPAILVGALVVFFAVSSAFAEARVMRPFFGPWNDSFTLTDVVKAEPLLADEPVSFDMNGMKEIADVVSKNAYQTLLTPSSVFIMDSTETEPKTELVISRQNWELADDFGARKVADDEGHFSNALWVMPGELQNALEAKGLLLPE